MIMWAVLILYCMVACASFPIVVHKIQKEELREPLWLFIPLWMLACVVAVVIWPTIAIDKFVRFLWEDL